MSHDSSLTYSDLIAITPSDTVNVYLHGWYVGGVGDVAVETEDGTQVTFKAMAAGSSMKDVRVNKILATGTTATLIIGLKP